MEYKDKVYIDIPIDLGERILPLELFICKLKDVKEKMKEMKHLT
jgi:hypothetical protein